MRYSSYILPPSLILTSSLGQKNQCTEVIASFGDKFIIKIATLLFFNRAQVLIQSHNLYMMHETKKQEEFSRTYLQAVAAVVGCTVSYPSQDIDSVDCTLSAAYQGALYSDAKIDVQLKCTKVSELPNGTFSFPLKKKNYDDLRKASLNPRMLLILLVPEQIDGWLSISCEQLVMKHCAYWVCLHGMEESENTTSVTLQISTENLFTVQALQKMVEKVANGERIS